MAHKPTPSLKIAWRVCPAPTGFYRSFEKRGWPSANFCDDESAAACLFCDDEYYASAARSGDHGPITIQIYTHTDNDDEGYKSFWIAKKASTLAEAKARVAEFYKRCGRDFMKSQPKDGR